MVTASSAVRGFSGPSVGGIFLESCNLGLVVGYVKKNRRERKNIPDILKLTTSLVIDVAPISVTIDL